MSTSIEDQERVFLHAMSLMRDGDNGSGEICKTLRLNGINDILGIFGLSKGEIEGLEYKENRQTFKLNRGQLSMICVLSAYNTNHIRAGVPLKILEWLNITQEMFDDFRIIYNPADYFVPTSGSSATSSTTGISSSGTGKTIATDLVREFKRGIKRDPSLFMELKDFKQWDPWYIDTKAQARAQDMDDILDPTYKANTAEEKAILDQKQRYMYAVWAKTLLTDKGKSLVRKHKKDYNAQQIHTDLLAHVQKSTKASVESSQLLTYITSTRLGTGSWRGSSHSFILHWQNQIRKYEQLVPDKDCFSNTIKRTMLENAVAAIQDLRTVKDQASQLQVCLGTPISYDEYCSLLLSAAMTYDSQFATNTNSKGVRRAVYNHNHINDHESVFNIDSDLQLLELNTTNIKESSIEANYSNSASRPQLNPQQWQQLSQDARNIWNSLDTNAKNIILGQGKTQQQQANTTHLGTMREPNGNGQSTAPNGGGHHNHKQEVTANVPAFNDNTILANFTQHKDLPPGNLQRLLSSSSTSGDKQTQQPSGTSSNPKEIVLDGKRYRQVNTSNIIYSHSRVTSTRGALIDRGANGGICGNDARVIAKTGRTVDVQGIDNHQIVDIPIVTAGAVVTTHRGPVILIMNQYAHVGNSKTIHLSGQMEWFGNDMNDKSIKVSGGLQRIATQDGYFIPLNIKSGLPYMTMRAYTDDKWDNLPHLILTSDVDWDPTVLDNTIDDDETWFDAITDLSTNSISPLFHACGNYRHCQAVHFHDAAVSDPHLGNGLLPNVPYLYKVFEQDFTPHEWETVSREPDYTSFIPNFGWQPVDIIKHTFAATTQYARIPMSTHLTRHFKAPFPALNVHRRQEAVATDTVYADVPAVDCGHTQAQFYCGVDSLVCDAYGMKTDKQFVNTFEDIIQQRGAMDKLISDGAMVETRGRAQDLFRAYVIGNWHSEPHQQHQNFAERKYQQVKNTTNCMMEHAGSPASAWLLALLYVCFLLNHTANETLKWRTPLECLTGTTPDISPLLRFH